MTSEPFDPKTVTAEELAAYSRGVRRARWGAVIAGVLAALVGLWVTVRFLPEWVGVIVVILAFAGVYRLTYEGLKPPGANIKQD